MKTTQQKKNQKGFIVSAELIFITTILVIGLIVGWVAIRDAVVLEMDDIATAIGSLDQTYTFPGTTDVNTNASTQGSQYNDNSDVGDVQEVSVLAPVPDTEALP